MTHWVPAPPRGADAALDFIDAHLSDLVSGERSASSIRGGERAARQALATFDVAGYAELRNEVLPIERRGASRLSPYVRHGLLPLKQVWNAVADGPERDVRKFRDELLWQEFARHWYAHHGGRSRHGIRRELDRPSPEAGWDRTMRCLDQSLAELHRDGWLVNQSRMWLASHWAIRSGHDWRKGEDEFFRHLLDGSRAANRLGWQWTAGVGSSKHYGFSQWQVQKRAPQLCAECEHQSACPIGDWPDDPTYVPAYIPTAAAAERSPKDLRDSMGPAKVESRRAVDTVWLTAESLGDSDPALAAWPKLPVVFVFDEPLLRRLRLSTKRLVFLVETLAEIAETRDLRLAIGSPAEALRPHAAAVTFAPVPGFRRLAAQLDLAAIHPWPWLREPAQRPVASFSAWRKR